jgi:ribonuclease HII
MLELEQHVKSKGFEILIGVDEAGRGPLAGPVVASAVVLKNYDFHVPIRDSKKLSPRQRAFAYQEIYQNGYVGVGIVPARIIDDINILEATFVAMNQAIEALIGNLPETLTQQSDFSRQVCLLIDGNQFKTTLPYAHETIVKGDDSVFSIACASIIAKVTRDGILDEYDRLFPEYGFCRHKGYPTKDHKDALKKFGPMIIHRKTFSY